ncbi:MAG: GNAT family N-acetyltransferase [Lachnospiraceae bacterium]|nr:GNAT family N-acetyltransferase [Lachnospiraceae bacterium]
MTMIETERLIIRDVEEKDAEGLFRLLANPRVNCFMDGKVNTIDEVYKHIQSSWEENELAVCLSDCDRFIGTLFGHKEEPDTYSICWNFLEEYSGKGYAYEAASAYFDYLFYEMSIRRIYAYVEDDNLPSQKLCKRLGMRQEGCFMEFISFVNNPDGTPKYENTMQFAILKKEWHEKHVRG